MFSDLLIVMHAGTPVVLSQFILTLMFVVLGILLIGISFGFITKSKESLLQHRWSMTVAIILALLAILFVMIPSFVRFYIDPDVQFYSMSSAITIIHGVIGVPAVIIGVVYALGDLPQKTKNWMRWAALFWVISMVLGSIVFLEMFGLFSITM